MPKMMTEPPNFLVIAQQLLINFEGILIKLGMKSKFGKEKQVKIPWKG